MQLPLWFCQGAWWYRPQAGERKQIVSPDEHSPRGACWLRDCSWERMRKHCQAELWSGWCCVQANLHSPPSRMPWLWDCQSCPAPDKSGLTYSRVQVNLQTLALVSIFQAEARERVIAAIEHSLPSRIPWLWDRLGYSESPAQLFHGLVLRKVAAFKAGVAVRQSRAPRGAR